MSDLLTKLESLAPASLWTLAPRDLLMKGAGLLATGDIADLHWTGEGTLEFEFPQRLNTLIHRMWLAGDRIEGQCDMHPVQPCAHHLASLMLCMHLMKDFTAFGRLPNRVLAQRLKARLLKHDERAVVAERPPQQARVPGLGRDVLGKFCEALRGDDAGKAALAAAAHQIGHCAQ